MALAHRGPGEALGEAARRRSVGQLAPRRLREARGQRAGASPAGTHERAVEAGDSLGQPARVADDARRAARRRLEHDQAEALEGDRRHERDVGCAVGVDQLVVRQAAEHAHAPRQRRAGGARGQLVAQRARRRRAAAASRRAAAPAARSTRRAGRRSPCAAPGAARTPPRTHPARRPAARASARALAGRERVERHPGGQHVHIPGAHAIALDEQPAKGAGQHDVRVRRGAGRRARAAGAGRTSRGVLTRGAALVGPRAVEVKDHRSPAQRAQQHRRGRVQCEVGVEQLGAGSGAPGGQPVCKQAARQRSVLARRPRQPTRARRRPVRSPRRSPRAAARAGRGSSGRALPASPGTSPSPASARVDAPPRRRVDRLAPAKVC